jgi:enoyl reductase
MSKAVIFSEYGSADVLRLVEAEPPRPGPGQVRVQVKSAGVQPFDCLFRSGETRAWVSARFPQRLGNEFAGVVDEVGEGVESLRPGDAVLGWAMLSAYAEHVVVNTEQVVRKPSGLSWAEAGVLSASGQTASAALDELKVCEGDTVLIHAAAGGVGTFAVQLARARGAYVIGTSSPRNHDFLHALGATPVAYGEGLTERVRAVAPRGVDAALIATGTLEALHTSLALAVDPARVGILAYQPAAEGLGVRRLSTQRSTDRLGALVRLHQEGGLRAVIQQRYPLTEAAEAHRVLETGHVRGKLVLIP